MRNQDQGLEDDKQIEVANVLAQFPSLQCCPVVGLSVARPGIRQRPEGRATGGSPNDPLGA